MTKNNVRVNVTNFSAFFKGGDNRPWCPSGLVRVSNSSRHSLDDDDRGSNPAWGYDMDRPESETTVANS